MSMSEQSYTTQLRHHIWSAHQRLESLPLLQQLQQATLTPKVYQRLLVAMFYYLQPLEQQLTAAELPIPLDWQPRLPHLIADLQALGQRLPPLTEAPPLPPLTHAEQRLGVIYVLEGSRLGGQLICRQLRQRFGQEVPLAYYGTQYGDWSHFKRQLDQHWQRSPAGWPLAAAAAQATFDTLHAWLQQVVMVETDDDRHKGYALDDG